MKYNKLKISVAISLFTIVLNLYTHIYAEDMQVESLPFKYDLRDYINIEVRDQMETNTCWAFSISSLLSSHLAYKYNEYYTFSPRHMEYVMSEDSLIDKDNEYAYKTKTLDLGGNENVIKQYLAQGTGPILEINMPFENNFNKINSEDLILDLSYKQVTEAAHILPMYKEWENGSIVYKDYNDNEIDKTKAVEYQNTVKNAIKEYGGIDSAICFNMDSYNYNNGTFNTKENNGNWHAVLLIGWDDTYSKDNFNENCKPLNDGAYIALNSWGKDNGNDGYMYISYEDVSVDATVKTYIKNIENRDYDNVYYEDLENAKKNNETLTEFTVVIDSRITGQTYASLKVDDKYVIKNALIDDCIENVELDTPIKLTANSKVELELGVSDEFKQYIYPYYYTTIDKSEFEIGNMTTDKLNKENNEIYLYTKHNVIDNGNKVDVKILKDNKDVTQDFKIKGNEINNAQTGIYISSKNAEAGEYIMTLEYNDEKFLKNFIVDEEVGKLTTIIGDISLDGKVTVTDLSQLKGYMTHLLELEGKRKDACDINEDGKITVLDVSILKNMLVGKII